MIARESTKKQVQKNLNQGEEVLQALTNAVQETLLLLDTKGTILSANEVVAERLGKSVQELIGTCVYDNFTPDVAKTRKEHFDNVVITGKPVRFEDTRQGRFYETYCYPVFDEKRRVSGVAVFAHEITRRKLAEKRQALTNNILEILNGPNEVINLVKRILLTLKDHTGIEAVGIRLKEGDDYPYCETNGFPDHFIEDERYLCARGKNSEIIRDAEGNPYLECMCGNIIQGRTNPSLPFFTKGGSFWSNNTAKPLASTPGKDRQARIRNRCNGEDYKSVALIPLKSGGKTIGLLQLNDKRPDCFSLDMIKFLEGIGNSIGIAVSRKQAGEVLRKSEEKYRSIFENAVMGIFWTTPDGRFLSANPAGARMWGYKSQEEMIQSATDIAHQIYAHPEDRKRFKELLENTGFVEGFEAEFYTRDGSKIWASMNARVIRDASGNILHYETTTEDITKRKQAENALRRSEQKYRSIFDNAAEGIFQTTPEGRYISVNPALARMIGYDSPEELMKGITDLSTQGYVNPEDRIRFKKTLEEQGTIKSFETQHYRKGGSTIRIIINARIVKDASGNVLYHEGTIEDITQQKHTEKALRESEERFKQVAVNANEVIWEVDADGIYRYCSSAVERILGYSADELVGQKHFYDLFAPDVREELKETAFATFQREEPFLDFINPNVHKNGSIVILETTGTPLLDKEGNLLGYRGANTDITSRKLAEESLKQTLEKLRKSLAGTIQAMSLTVETRDPYTAGHQKRVSNLARAIAQEMGLSSDTVDNIRMAGIIHDIGKISVPAELLSKPTKLTEMEMNLIRIHPQSGYDILKDVELPYPIAEMVLQHHERLDGSGYPQGLNGDRILIESKIIAVADVVEAIATHRPYRPARGIGTALEEIEKNKGILYDVGAVEVCLKLFREGGFKLE